MQQGFQVKVEEYLIGDTTYHIRSLLNKQQYSDPDGVAEKAGIGSANWSLFGVIWPSGQVLARCMNTHLIDGLHILEVGCGLALASLVVKQRGGDITTSDYHPMVPSFLAANTGLNALNNIAAISGDWSVDEVESEKFDLIIGSDVLYERGHFDMLSGYIDRHAKPKAEVMIVDPGRGHVGKFSRRMRQLGFSNSSERVEMLLENSEQYRGRVLTYQRGQALSFEQWS